MKPTRNFCDMFASLSSYSILYTLTVWILASCYGFVLLSSATRQHNEVNLFVPGDEFVYNLHSTVLLNEKFNASSKNVGFFISAQVVLQVVWGKESQKIFKLQMKDPKLHIKSRKAPSPDGFVYHTSKLESFENEPFYICWNSGKISTILVHGEESTSLVNLKKGIASLFQFQLLDGQSQETDSSGTCSVEYTSPNQDTIVKLKFNCKSPDLPYQRNPDVTLDASISSLRTITYSFDSKFRYFRSITSQEIHTMALPTHMDYGNRIQSEQKLDFVEFKPGKIDSLSGENLKEVVYDLMSSGGLSEESLKTEKESTNSEVKKFSDGINELRGQLNGDLLGSAVPAKAFIKLVALARKADVEDIKKSLNGKKHKDILPQVLDVLGSSPTMASYEAVMSKLDFNKEEQLDLCERYLWALSIGAHPNPEVIEKLLVKFRKSTDISSKLRETLLLTVASMSYRVSFKKNAHGQEISQKVEKLILEKLRDSKPEDSYVYLRALKNLRSPTTIQDLLKKIKEGTTKEGALAWKAIIAFDKKHWSQDVLNSARKTYLQLDRKHDSSSRTLASEILLESGPNDDVLREIIYHLASNDTVFEIKQYALQKIRMLSEDDADLHRRVLEIIRSDRRLNNYSILNPRGLSTAIKRSFVKNSYGKGSLVSLQEIHNSVVKRGVVNVVWDKDMKSNELFSLGVFTSGLTSFLSNDNADPDEEPEATSAGMELAVLGTQFRPFVFFNGQGELMGHVWSGTASERTTAYQALVMLQDHSEFLRLGSGFIVEIDLKGAVSFDLAGKIEISIWGRTANSLVEKCAGVFITGSMKVDTSFIGSQVEFTVTLEPQLKMESDTDFSSSVRFCMRFSQLDVLLRHNIYKIERIPGSRHKMRIAKYKKTSIPGVTYALNRKNNEMCSAMQ